MSEPDTPTNYDGHEDNLTSRCKTINRTKWGDIMKVFDHICKAGNTGKEIDRDTLAQVINYIEGNRADLAVYGTQ